MDSAFQARYLKLVQKKSIWINENKSNPNSLNVSNSNQSIISQPNIDQLLTLEKVTEDFFASSSLPLKYVTLKVGFTGIPASTAQDSLSSVKVVLTNSTDGSNLTPLSSGLSSDTSLALADLEVVNTTDLSFLTQILTSWSIVLFSPNPKKINIFTVAQENISFQQIHQYLFDLIYIHTHDLGPGANSNLPKLLYVIESYLLLISTPGSSFKGLLSFRSINWVLSLLTDIIKKLLALEISQPQVNSMNEESPETSKELDINDYSAEDLFDESLYLEQNDKQLSPKKLNCILESLEACLILLVKIIQEYSDLNSLSVTLVNFLGLCSSCDPFDSRFEYSLRELAYICQSFLLRSELFLFKDLFPISMKWIYYDITGKFFSKKSNQDRIVSNRVNRATDFLCSCLDLVENNGLSFLQSFFKQCCTEFSDNSLIRNNLAASIAKILTSLTYPSAYFLLENLFKDCIRASAVAIRSLTIEIFTAWVTTFLNSRLLAQNHQLSSYTPEEIDNLLVGLIDLISTRFTDRNQFTCAKGLSAFYSILTLVKTQSRRNSPRQALAIKLLKHFIEASYDERFQLSLKECCSSSSHNVRRLSLQIVSSILTIHLKKYSSYDLNSLQLCSWLDLASQSFLDRCRDSNYNVRKICFNSLSDCIMAAFYSNKNLFELTKNDHNQSSNGYSPFEHYTKSNPYPFNAFEKLWHLWIETALPSMFDSERLVVLSVLNATTDFFHEFQDDSFLALFLTRPFSELSLKGIKQIFFMLHHKQHIQQYTARTTNLDQSHVVSSENRDLTPLMESQKFIAFLFNNEDIHAGHWQLASAYSEVSQPSEDTSIDPIFSNILLVWKNVLSFCTSNPMVGHSSPLNDLQFVTSDSQLRRNAPTRLDSQSTSNSDTEVVPSEAHINSCINVGNSVLMILYNWIPIHLSQTLFSEVATMILDLGAPIEWMPTMLQLLRKWDQEYQNNYKNKKLCNPFHSLDAHYGKLDNFHDYTQVLLKKQTVLCQRYLSSQSDDVLLNSMDSINSLSKAIFVMGELSTLNIELSQSETAKQLVQLIGRISSRTLTKNYFFPHSIRSQAFIAFGKITIVNESYFKQLINMIVHELDLDQAVIQHDPDVKESDIFVLPLMSKETLGGTLNDISLTQCSALIVFADLSFRYTSLVELYIPLIANCLRHPHPKVRYLTFLVLTKLLRSDYIKWRDHLSCKFIVALITEKNSEVREFAYYCFVHVLLIKSPSLLLDDFTKLIMFINGYHDYEFASCIRPTATEESLFSFPGSHEVRRRYRHRCYKFILEHLSPELRFRSTYILCEKILAQAAQGKIDTKRIHFRSAQVVKDVFDILSSKETQIHVPRAPNSNSDENEDPLSDLDPTNLKKIASLNIQNVLDNIIPVIISLKDQLEKICSPLQGVLMQCLGKIIINFHVDLNSLVQIIGSDILNEIRYDLDRFISEEKISNKSKNRKKFPITPRSVRTPNLTPRCPQIGLYPETPLVTSITEPTLHDVIPIPAFSNNQVWVQKSVKDPNPLLQPRDEIRDLKGDNHERTKSNTVVGDSDDLLTTNSEIATDSIDKPKNVTNPKKRHYDPEMFQDWNVPFTSTPRPKVDSTDLEATNKKARRNPLRTNRLRTYNILQGLENLGKEHEPLTIQDYLADLVSPFPDISDGTSREEMFDFIDDSELNYTRLPGLENRTWANNPGNQDGELEPEEFDHESLAEFMRTPVPKVPGRRNNP